MAHPLPGFQGIRRCVQYLASHPHKHIFYLSNFYDGSNVIRLTRGGNKVEDHTSYSFLECHQDEYHTRILNRRWSVMGMIHTLFGVSVCLKLQIQPGIAYDSTDREIRCMCKYVKKNRIFWR